MEWCRIEPSNADEFEPSITHELEITGREYSANNGQHLIGEGVLLVVDPSVRGASEEASQRDLTTS
ncbi:hypothetical protein N9N28_17260 [Rubripirellula amarantea]|nr:hypothetical protein [Rubripirellula amarantea]